MHRSAHADYQADGALALATTSRTSRVAAGNGPECSTKYGLRGNECADPAVMEGALQCYVSDTCERSKPGAAARWKRCKP